MARNFLQNWFMQTGSTSLPPPKLENGITLSIFVQLGERYLCFHFACHFTFTCKRQIWRPISCFLAGLTMRTEVSSAGEWYSSGREGGFEHMRAVGKIIKKKVKTLLFRLFSSTWRNNVFHFLMRKLSMNSDCIRPVMKFIG